MTRARVFAVLGITLLIMSRATSAFAWNDHGHMMVAAVAYRQLAPGVRARVDALLKLNPFYQRWLDQLPPALPAFERPAALFMIAATWADQIKGAPEYSDDGTAGGNRPAGPVASLNKGYDDLLRHKYWHFVDIPFATDRSPLPPVPVPNIIERIAVFRAAVASGASDDLKSYDLCWLMHLVGDIHQPLHVITRVSKAQPNGDDGGNLVGLCAAPCRDTLHGFWDGILGSDRSPTAVMQDASALPTADVSRARDLDPAHWAAEGFALAKTAVYVAPIGEGPGPFVITPTYEQNARDLAKTQVALAGARLAALLNTSLK